MDHFGGGLGCWVGRLSRAASSRSPIRWYARWSRNGVTVDYRELPGRRRGNERTGARTRVPMALVWGGAIGVVGDCGNPDEVSGLIWSSLGLKAKK
jgi:hypothetical protein